MRLRVLVDETWTKLLAGWSVGLEDTVRSHTARVVDLVVDDQEEIFLSYVLAPSFQHVAPQAVGHTLEVCSETSLKLNS